MNYGFIKTEAVSPDLRVADCRYNTEKIIEAVSDLTEKDTVFFLVSGGGSALFEKPLISEYNIKKKFS